jgi:hypothetical protein
VSCSNSTEPIEPLVETTTLSNSTVHATDSVIVDVTIENVSRQAQTIDGSVCPAAYLLTTMDDEIVGPGGGACTLESVAVVLQPGAHHTFSQTWTPALNRDPTNTPRPITSGTYNVVSRFFYDTRVSTSPATIHVVD